MWWSGLPGLDSPSSPRLLADRAVAAACADRIRAFDHSGDIGTRTHRMADDFSRWIGDAQDGGDAHARRIALCIACERVPADTKSSDVISTAKWLHRFLSRE